MAEPATETPTVLAEHAERKRREAIPPISVELEDDRLLIRLQIGEQAWLRFNRYPGQPVYFEMLELGDDCVSMDLDAGGFLLPAEEVDGLPEGWAEAALEASEEAWFVDEGTWRRSRWRTIDQGTGPFDAMHVSVEPEFVTTELAATIIKEAEVAAKRRGIGLLRTDAPAREATLCEFYESHGFERVDTEQVGDDLIAFYQKRL